MAHPAYTPSSPEPATPPHNLLYSPYGPPRLQPTTLQTPSPPTQNRRPQRQPHPLRHQRPQMPSHSHPTPPHHPPQQRRKLGNRQPRPSLPLVQHLDQQPLPQTTKPKTTQPTPTTQLLQITTRFLRYTLQDGTIPKPFYVFSGREWRLGMREAPAGFVSCLGPELRPGEREAACGFLGTGGCGRRRRFLFRVSGPNCALGGAGGGLRVFGDRRLREAPIGFCFVSRARIAVGGAGGGLRVFGDRRLRDTPAGWGDG